MLPVDLSTPINIVTGLSRFVNPLAGFSVNDSTQTDISYRLRHVREMLVGTERGSQKAFAEAAGLKPSTYSDYESRGVEPTAGVIGRIIRAFPEINVRWLVTGEGQPLASTAAEEAAQYKAVEQIDLDLVHQLEERLKERQEMINRIEELEQRVAELEAELKEKP